MIPSIAVNPPVSTSSCPAHRHTVPTQASTATPPPETTSAAAASIPFSTSSISTNLLSPPFTLLHSMEAPSFRQKIAFYLDTSKTGRVLDLLDALLSAGQCVLFVSNTAFIAPTLPHSLRLDDQHLNAQNRRTNAIPLPTVNIVLEVILAVGLLAFYVFRTYVAPSRSFFLMSSYAILTVLSAVPVLVAYSWAYFDWAVYFSYMSAGPVVFAFPFRWARLHEVLSMVFMPVKDPLFRLSPIARKTVNVSCAIFFTLLTVSGLIHITLYKDNRQLAHRSTFLDIFFFTVMSSTSGLSTSITADSWLTRFLLLYIMIAGAFYIPTHLSELLGMIRTRSKFTNPYSPPGNNQSHVVVTGTFDANGIIEFLREFFCPDHGPNTITTTVVFLNPDEPDENLKNVLQDPAYMSRVRYIKGTSTSFHTLDRAKTRDAKAVFVLSSKLASESGDPFVDDAETVMRALAIKKYCPHLPCFVQSMLPENQNQFHYLADQILCVDELTLGILSQSARVPGFSTLISLLCSSMTEQSRQTLVCETERQKQGFLKPYIRGASQEVYVCTFPNTFVGLTFSEVSRVIYNQFGACLIALGVPVDCPDLPPSLRFHLVLNPASHIITGQETGFVIGVENEVVMQIRDFKGPINLNTAVLNHSFSQHSSELDLVNGGEPVNFVGSPVSLSVPGTEPHGIRLKVVPQQYCDSDEEHELSKHPVPSYYESFSETSSLTGSVDSKPEHRPTAPGSSIPPPAAARVSKHSIRHVRKNFRSLAPQSMRLNATGSLLHVSQKPPQNTPGLETEEDEETVDVCDHIILCDASPHAKLPEYLDLFIEPLRDRRIVSLMPVVVLSLDDPPESIFKYDQVFHVRGNPMRRVDLLRAGISRSAKLVICCSQRSARRVADAGSILCALNAESINHQYTFPVIEFVWKENMKYVGDTKIMSGLSDSYAQTILRPAFMAGHAFSTSLLDGVLAQSYYSPHLLSLIKRLVYPGRESLLEKLIHKGHSISTDFSPVSRTASPKSILPLQDTYIHLLDVGNRFLGRKYVDLYNDLAHHGIISLGLYRTIENSLTQRPISFTLVNPRQLVQLRKGDKVYVLSNQRH